MFSLLLLSLAPACVVTAPVTATRVTLEGPLARCLDGSQAVYYISPGSHPSAFYIFHQGGGWCQTAEKCARRSLGHLGTSKFSQATMELDDTTGVLMERDPNRNPLLHNWTYVYVPYCDGGSFTGDSEISVAFGMKKLHFRGLRIREALVKSLKNTVGFDVASDLIIGGCSAGGAAAYFHADWYSAQVPHAKARLLPNSGWFLEGDYARDFKQNYGALMANMFDMINSSASLSRDCVADLGHKCLFAPNYVRYVKMPLFALNSRYDASMNTGEYEYDNGTESYRCTSYVHFPCDPASVNAFGERVAGTMRKSLASPHGAFLDSCYRHCSIIAGDPLGGNYASIEIDSYTAAMAVDEWYRLGSEAMANGGFFERATPYPCHNCCSGPAEVSV